MAAHRGRAVKISELSATTRGPDDCRNLLALPRLRTQTANQRCFARRGERSAGARALQHKNASPTHGIHVTFGYPVISFSSA